jgi:hypothetical protein
MDNKMNLTVAPAAEVRRDVGRNLPWIFGLSLATLAYFIASTLLIRHFEDHWGFWHAGYFTVINVTTVGFGDVVPFTHAGKVLAGINGFVGLLLFGALIAVVTIAFQPASWSTTLTSSGAAEHPDQPQRGDKDILSHKTAAALESLAILLRAVDQHTEHQSGGGNIRIHVHGNQPDLVAIEIFIHAH